MICIVSGCKNPGTVSRLMSISTDEDLIHQVREPGDGDLQFAEIYEIVCFECALED